MQAEDTLLVCDADCLCMRPLEQLFSDTRKHGSALYDASDRPDLSVNGITLKEMTDIYTYLGNGINHDLCVKFVESGYDMTMIQKEG